MLQRKGPRIQIPENSSRPTEFHMRDLSVDRQSSFPPAFHMGIFTEGAENLVRKTRTRIHADECSDWSDKESSPVHGRRDLDYRTDHDDSSNCSTEQEHFKAKQFGVQKTMLKLRPQYAMKKTVLEISKPSGDVIRPYTQKIMLELRKSSERDSDSGCHSSVSSECPPSPDSVFERRETRKTMLQLKPRNTEAKLKIDVIRRNAISSESDDNKTNIKPRTPIDYFAPPVEHGKMPRTQEYATHITKKKALVQGLSKIKIPTQQEMRVRYGGPHGSPRSPRLPVSPRSPAAFARMKRKNTRLSASRGEGEEEHIDFIAAGIVEFALAESPRCWERSFFK